MITADCYMYTEAVVEVDQLQLTTGEIQSSKLLLLLVPSLNPATKLFQC